MITPKPTTADAPLKGRVEPEVLQNASTIEVFRTLALLDSMINGGEPHSPASMKMYEEAKQKLVALESALSAAEGRLREIAQVTDFFIGNLNLMKEFYSAKEIAERIHRLAASDAVGQEEGGEV